MPLGRNAAPTPTLINKPFLSYKAIHRWTFKLLCFAHLLGITGGEEQDFSPAQGCGIAIDASYWVLVENVP